MKKMSMKESIEEICLESDKILGKGIKHDQIDDKTDVVDYVGNSDNFRVNLPGQIYSSEDTTDTSSSSKEFDIETFRNSNASTRKQDQSSKDKIYHYGIKKFLKFLGIEFEISKIQERNRDPILFLQTMFGGLTLFILLIIIIYGAGLNFRIIPLLLTLLLIILTIFTVIYCCKLSVQNGIQFDPKMYLVIILAVNTELALFVYSFLVKFPFNSLPLFLVLNYIMNIITCLFGSFMLISNSTPFDDPNYQLKFFGTRLMTGFFNGTGVTDVQSDIVLGIQLVQYPSKKFLIIGIFLLVLCNVDEIQVNRKIFTPQKITLRNSLFTLFVEVVVLVLTGIVLGDIPKNLSDKKNEDALYVTVISISTTIINLSHNIIIALQQFFSNSKTSIIL